MPAKKDAILACWTGQTLKLPLYSSAIKAGFPSPADDYIESRLDLNEHLIRHPSATFFVRASGDSMVKAGIGDGDLMIVDRAVSPQDGDVVIAVLYGDLTVKRIRKRHNRLLLEPDNGAYPAIEVPPDANLQVWGVVTHSIHRMARK